MGEAMIQAAGPWWFVWAIAVAILGVGRWARLLTYDRFPPAMAVRQGWTNWVTKHKHDTWNDLFYCQWCLAPWLMLICIGWFALSFLAVWIAWTWWLFWAWGAISYLASMVVARDEPGE